jgi:transporter family-2 protein
MAFAFLVLALAAGAALPFQAGINARLATFIGGPIRASAISFAVGTIVLVLLALVVTRGVMGTGRLEEVPWWGWLGGAVGAGYVASTVAAAPRLGALNLFAAVIFGQLLCSVVPRPLRRPLPRARPEPRPRRRCRAPRRRRGARPLLLAGTTVAPRPGTK